jgi:hypothetical protein
VLPPAASPAAPPIVQADRAYQHAAALFYAERFDAAAQRFDQIAADAGSPWRGLAALAAARAFIRRGMLQAEGRARREALAEAERRLQRIVRDAALKPVHDSARRLLDFVQPRLRPAQTVGRLSRKLLSTTARGNDLATYTFWLDRFIGDTVHYRYEAVAEREALRQDPLTDWILALQGAGEEATARAIQQWRAQPDSLPWLIAALWKVPANHETAGTLLDRAAAVPRDSPAAPTASFLRVRLLLASGRRADARTLLAALPDEPEGAFSASAVNLLRAQRFMLAQSIEELVAALSRFPSAFIAHEDATDLEPLSFERDDLDAGPIVERDGAIVFSERLPLGMLVRAALIEDTPPSVRYRLAMAAWSRAFLLGETAAAIAVAPVLARLLPPLASGMQGFIDAADETERRRWALLIHLRFPGIHAYVMAGREWDKHADGGVLKGLGRLDAFRDDAWWCSFERETRGQPEERKYRRFEASSALPALLFDGGMPAAPGFLTQEDRRQAEAEVERLASMGAAVTYFADEAARWAREAPHDGRAAEALARAIRGARWACGDARTGAASRRAFQTLHRLFPKSEWARRTKYWYNGRG